MSTAQNTVGLIAPHKVTVDTYYRLQGADGRCMARVFDGDDARRLAACWNALEGVPTDWLESYVAGNVSNLLQDKAELLAATKDAADALENDAHPKVVARELREAIAKVVGAA